ncbi:MAG TPA: efflux transporter outer membrane subunit [Bryobacteraceae bacterium]|jgi:NodT family efflux transporter outer membrane factor (OMF) lipoprotein|nr:efflux transporter outer membrane subunit [Bryobacteraceae bacterium]
MRKAIVPFLALLAAGCSVGPKYQRPVLPAPVAYKEAPPQAYKEWHAANPSDSALRGDWWTLFHDSDLTALEERIDVSNQNLKAAEARYAQARALIKVSQSQKYPTVTAGAGVTSNRDSGTYALANSKTSSQFGDFSLPVDVSYEVDAWGRVRHSIEASRDEAQATAADLETLRLSYHAELAFDYFELRSADAEQKLLDDTVVEYRKALELTENRFEGGVAAGSEVAQAKTQLEATRTQDTDLAVRRAQYEHALAVLTGRSPAEFSLPARSIVDPPAIPVGLPSQLLERRPDIAASERRVAEANAQVGIARAAFFPQILLGAALGLEGQSIADWLNWPSRFWAVGPSVLQTVFDGGRRRATQQAAESNYEATVANYRETALDAFQQVEDNLAALRVLEQETATQRAAVVASEQSLELSTNRYTGGLVTYLEVVTAQGTALANERLAVDILRRRMDASVLLIKALGGGWDRSKLPS